MISTTETYKNNTIKHQKHNREKMIFRAENIGLLTNVMHMAGWFVCGDVIWQGTISKGEAYV